MFISIPRKSARLLWVSLCVLAACSTTSPISPVKQIGQGNVQLVAYVDLKCPDARVFVGGILPTIQTRHIDTGRVVLTSKLVSFLPGSMPAANAVYCVAEQDNGAFYAYLAYLYAHQPPEYEDWATPKRLLAMAEAAQLNIDVNKLETCMAKGAYEDLVQHNNEEEKHLLAGALHSPVVLVNGKRIIPAGRNPFISPSLKQVEDAIENSMAP